MKRKCNLFLSQLSFKDMRYFAIIGILCTFAPAAFAQAADKDAIDFSGKMDTVARWTDSYDILGNLNVRLQNPDNWEDFEIITSPNGAQSNYGVMHFGGPLLFDSLDFGIRVGGEPSVYMDMDGDGVGDLLTHNILWYKGKKQPPYFDPSSNAMLHYEGFPETGIAGTQDYDGDGFNDLLIAANNGKQWFRLYSGGTNFVKSRYIFPTDSISIPRGFYLLLNGAVVAKFGKNLPPQIVFGWYDTTKNGKPDYRIGIIPHKKPLHQDSVIWLSYSDSGGIAVQNLFAMDITGDGIPDLLVSDGFNVYIFKGGDDFGTYPLTPEHAFYRIKSPRLLDFGNYGFVKNFGEDIHACGDITGSGIPYVCIGAHIDEGGGYKGYEFIYAGGKALDSLFDALLGYVNQGPLFTDTLHSIDATGRTAGLVVNGNANGGFDNDLLLFKGCDKIPHKTNPQMNTAVVTLQENFEATCFPSIGNKFVKVQITSALTHRCTIEIFDLLGRKIDRREVMLDLGNNTEYYDTSQFPEGTYIVRIISDGQELNKKFIIHH